MKQKHLITPLMLALALAGCGGGGGGGGETAASSNEDQLLARGGIPGSNKKPAGTTTDGTTSGGTTTGGTTTGGTTTGGTTTGGTTTGGTTTTAPTTSLVTYSRTVDGAKRTFDFDGATPFVNAATGQSDMHDWLYNARYSQYYQITNSGVSPWIQKVTDNGAQVTRFQVFPTDAQIYNWRTQASAFPFENYKHYRYDLEFKLDPSWDFNMPNGDGLLWQSKGMPKSGQYSHAAMSMGLSGNNLYFSVLYPNSANRATTWPTSLTWSGSDYVPTSIPTRSLVAGRYYKVRIEYFADDRPTQFGGQGYLDVYLDDVLWFQHRGPNTHPDQNGPHRWDFGWYNWGGQPSSTRAVYFKTSRAYVK